MGPWIPVRQFRVVRPVLTQNVVGSRAAVAWSRPRRRDDHSRAVEALLVTAAPEAPRFIAQALPEERQYQPG